MGKKIAVIGSGASGITAIKTCLEVGLDVVCFERTNRIGGLWYYTEEVTDGQSCVMKTTVINTSKEIMCYSDYPIPAEYPMYMHNSYVIKYFLAYAKHFDCVRHIKFNHEVLNLKQADDYDKTGQWLLTVKDQDGNTSIQTFDGVMVCSGHHADKRLAHFEGMENFKGKIVHTHDYRSHIGYENKRVVVVGIGNSGGDVAVELSRIASQVYLSTRRGSWVINRIAENGYPGDLVNIRRVTDIVRRKLPHSLVNNFAENKVMHRFNHANYGLKPKHRLFSQHPTVNDELPNRVACGALQIRPNIKRITSTSIEFDDGRIEEDIDVIILATGYKFGFPFIEHPALKVENNEVNLFKYVFPPDLSAGSLAVIGCIQPLGAIMPISEIQCRWAVRVFKGEVSLPPRDVMWEDVRLKKELMQMRYVSSPRHTIQVDYIPIMDEVGELAGCKPDLGKLFWKDPVLALKCFFGPFVPYQYRLEGPHSWSGARKAIMTVWDRTFAPTLPVSGIPKDDSWPTLVYVMGIIIVAVMMKWFIGMCL